MVELKTKLNNRSVERFLNGIKRLDDIHVPTLKKLVRQSVKHVSLRSA